MADSESRPPPTLRSGSYIFRSDLARVPVQRWKTRGVSHTEAAETLEASHRTAVTRTVDPSNPSGVVPVHSRDLRGLHRRRRTCLPS